MSTGMHGDCTCYDCQDSKWDWEPVCDECLGKRTDLHAKAVKELLAVRVERDKLWAAVLSMLRIWETEVFLRCGDCNNRLADKMVETVPMEFRKELFHALGEEENDG